MSASAIYHHLGSSPVTTGGGLTCSLCLYIEFSGAPSPEAGATVNDEGLVFDNCYRAQPNEEDGSYSFVLDGSDGSTNIERAHKGATNVIKQIAQGRGFSISYDDIQYAGA
jgi:hypothetical protein